MDLTGKGLSSTRLTCIPLQMTIKSSYCYLYFWLTSYKLEIPRIPSLNANNMLEWFTKFRKTDSLLFIRVVSLAVPGLSCSMWDLVPWAGIKPRPPAVEVSTTGPSLKSPGCCYSLYILYIYIYIYLYIFFFLERVCWFLRAFSPTPKVKNHLWNTFFYLPKL